MALDFSTARYLGPLADAEPESAATPRPPLDFSRAKRIGDVPKPSGFLRRAVGDTALSVGQGVVGLGEAAVGALDIPTLGRAGKALKDYTGYDPHATTQFLEELKTPEQQQANREVAEAKGFGGTLSALAQNPSVIPQKIAETIPLIAGGGAVARALPAKLSALARGAIGEGALAAGSAAEQTRSQTEGGVLTPEQAALNLTSGAVTGLITRGSGALANKLGIGDIEQLAAGGTVAPTTKGLARRTVEGALTEGVLEEAPQSAQEQALQNIALGRPAGEGVPEATAIGGVLGSVIGAGASALPQGALPPAEVPPGVVPPAATPPGSVAPEWGTTTGVFPQGQPVEPGPPPPIAPEFETALGAAGGLSDSNGQSIPAALGAAPPWETALGAGVTTTPREDISGAYRDQEIAALLRKTEEERAARGQQRDQQGEMAMARGRAEGIGEPQPETAMQRAFREAQEKENERKVTRKAAGQAPRATAEEAAGALQGEAAAGRPPTDADVAAALRAEQDKQDALSAGRGRLGAAQEGQQPEGRQPERERVGEVGKATTPGGRDRVEEGGAVTAETQAQVDAAAHEAATSPRNDLPEPTEAQQKAGNYKHGHVRLHGLDLSIEHPQGSVRRGVDKGGKPWAVTMAASYGYIKGTTGKDKNHIDAYVGPNPESDRAFVVDQIDPKTGRFDEHKSILGARSLEEATEIYDAHFSDGSGPARRKAVSEVSVDAFKAWLSEGDTKRPFAAAKTETPPATGIAEGEIAPPAASQEAELPSGDIEKAYNRVNDLVVDLQELRKDGKTVPDAIYTAVLTPAEHFELAMQARTAQQFPDDKWWAEWLKDAAEGAAQVERWLAEESRGAIGGKTAPQKIKEGGTTQAEEYPSAKEPVKHFDERLSDPGTQTTLSAMAANSGWQQRGGQLLRDAEGKAAGRTTWIPREAWFAELPERLNEAGTVEAVRKAIAGEKLGAKERRVVGFMLDAIGREREEGAVVADEEGDREAREERAAIADTALDALSDDDTATLLSYDTLNDDQLEEFFGSEPPSGDKRAEETPARGEAGGRGAPGEEARPPEEPLLETYTETELREREEARVATERREAEERAARLTKAEADKALADFVLSGSDREADELAARGQASLFDQPTREVDRRLYAMGADNARLRELAFAGKREEFDKAAKEELQKIQTDLAAAGTAEEGRATLAVDIDKLPESFFRSLYKRARRLAVEAQRDPAVREAAVNAALLEQGIPVEPALFNAFIKGFDHALAGKTKSTLTEKPLGLRESGYDAARKWLGTPEGRAYYQGKRVKKLEGTGVELRRHWEQKVRALSELATNDAEVVIATVEAATKRAELFAPVLSEGATPGVKRYIFALRNELIPFMEWFGREGPARYAGRRKHAPRVRIRNYITQETQGEANIAMFKQDARAYIDRISRLAQAFNGVATIDEATEALKRYVTGSKFTGDFKTRTQEWQALLPHIRHSARFMSFLSSREVDRMRDVEQVPDSDDNATSATPLVRPKLDKIVRTSDNDWRRGKDVTPRHMKDTFGFADVGFGKWVATKQDQDHLNYAYDAFRDLAEFIGIEPTAIGLGGSLHFTIGALGHGRHSAHYSPNHPHPDGGTVAVINVTNTKGDGSVSHEWMHALDFHMRKESAEGHRGVQAVKDALVTKYSMDAILKALPRFFSGISKFNRGYGKAGPVKNAQYAVTYYGKGVTTDFMKEALALGKDYWANENEPFARAGEAWVHDGLKGRNDYLVSDWVAEGKVKKPPFRGVPYPTGDERSAFGEWYKALFASLEWRADGPHFSPAKWAKNAPTGLAEHRNELDKLREAIPEMYEDWLVQDAAARAAREKDATDEALAKVEAERAQEATAATGTAGPATDAELENLFDAVVAEKRESLQESPEAQTPGGVSVETHPLDTTPVVETETPKGETQPLAKKKTTGKKTVQQKTAAHLIKESAKLGVKGVDEAMKGLADLFGAGRIQSFPGGFDEEAYAKAKPHFEAALKAFQAAGKTLKELFKMLLDTFGEGIRPYAIRFAKDNNLSTQGNLKGDASVAGIAGIASGPQPEVATDVTPAAPLPPHSPHITLAADLRDRLLTDDTTPITAPELFRLANAAYGGTIADGKYISKDAYDALELGLSEVLVLRATTAEPGKASTSDISADIKTLEALQEKLPTPSKRSDEQVSLQQFSTPPTFAKAMAWAANIGQTDIVLEPSAGTGNIVTQALTYRPAEMHANEISGRRADMLAGLSSYANNYDYPALVITRENAMHLHGLLPGVDPTVILMNPPFSADINRPGQKATEVGAQHVEAALKKLAPGGRLVALLGRGMGLREGGAGRPAFYSWWKKIQGEYNVRANIGIAGRAYRKFGTEFETVMVVIDKTGPTKGAILNKQVDALEALPALLESIRNDRGPAQKPSRPDKRPATEPGGEAAAGARGEDTGPGVPVLLPTDVGLPPRVPEGAAAGHPQRSPGDGGEHADVLRPPAAGDGLPPQKRGGRGGRVGAGPAGVRGSRAGPAGPRPGALPGAEDKDGGNLEGVPHPIEDTAGHTLVEAGEQQAGELEAGVTYEKYRPSVTLKGAQPHPTPLAESAAMASVRAPKAIYIPQLPKSVVTGGALSDAQLTGVILAGQSHEEILANGERRGFFIGDGTGVGKGATIAGVILDNWNQGRKKAVWISENQRLFNDAARDVAWVGFDEKVLIKQADIKGKIKSKEAILFTSYDTLKDKSGEVKDATGKVIKEAEERIDQIVEWLGPDFDGVIAFDEAHNMGNATERKGKRGKLEASAKALAGVDLQKRLPKARILYVSATGATEVANFAFADRLGLWGEGTSFADKHTFISAIDAGGVAAMEVVAKDMKSMGLYQARSLGFDGIEYRELLHELPEAQGEMYDTLARTWQMVNDNIESVMEDTGQAKNGIAKGRAMAAYWGAQQRFFNQVLTALSAPSLVRDIQAQLDAGNSAVLQLVNTNEAISKRRMAQAAAAGQELAEVDITPRDILMQYVQNSFPVNLYEETTDDDGNPKWEPVLDAAGQPVQDPAAVAKRDALLEKLATLPVPEGIMEQIINHFGVDTVAEITGRKRRIVRLPDGKVEEQKLSDAKANVDASAFMEGKKRILIFSNAGGTGRSYHSDLGSKNQQKRIHYLVQPGWIASKAMQGLGRTHRTNQKYPPEYVLVTTNLKAQRRFLSSIARRLDQLGALTKGERKSANQGLFAADMNLENVYSQLAITSLTMEAGTSEVAGGISRAQFLNMGINAWDQDGNVITDKIPKVPTLLNRLLSLEQVEMNRVFDAFYERVQANVEYARQTGSLDIGMETLTAQSVVKTHDDVVAKSPGRRGDTRYTVIELTNPVRFTQFDELPLAYHPDFMRNKRSGAMYAVVDAPTITNPETGALIKRKRRIGVSSAQYMKVEEFKSESYESLDTLSREEQRAAWDKEIAASPQMKTSKVHLVTGALLPVWDRLPQGMSRILRAQTDEGERILGREIAPKDLNDTLKRLGADVAAVKVTPAEAVRVVMEDAATLELANGWKISRRMVNQEPRLEIVGPTGADLTILKDQGAFTEIIAYRPRVFIPLENAADVMARITASKPIVEVIGADAAKFSRGTERTQGQSAAELRKNLVKRLGTRAIEGLERAGFEIVETEDQLPPEIQPKSGKPVRGVYWGKSYLVASNIPEGTELSVLLHEIGVHHGLEGLLGTKLHRALLSNIKAILSPLERAIAAGKSEAELGAIRARIAAQSPLAKALVAARGRVPNNTRAGHINEEVLAYTVEDNANSNLTLVKRVLGAIRAWLIRHGFQLKEIGPEDLVALARASVFAVSREATVQRAPLMAAPAYAAQAPTFYSEMAKFIDAKAPGKAPAAQWKALLDAWAKAGKFKADELEWSGVKEWLDLQGGTISKDALLNFISGWGVQVEETTLGDLEARKAALIDEIDAARGTPAEDALQEEMSDLHAKSAKGTLQVKFGQYQLPGAKEGSYRELLLRLPVKEGEAEARREARMGQLVDDEQRLSRERVAAAGRGDAQDQDDFERQLRNVRTQMRLVGQESMRGGFTSSHFDQPNILAHVRFNERTDADGKKVLFLEEIQSDWAQKGKREGFKQLPKKPLAYKVVEKDGAFYVAKDEGKIPAAQFPRTREEAHRLADELNQPPAGPGVSAGPFVQKTEAWVGLALKRMIRYAAENGFDRIAWTTGEQQAERYDQSKQLDSISVRKAPSDRGYVVVGKKGNIDVFGSGVVQRDKLADHIGKELADRAITELDAMEKNPAKTEFNNEYQGILYQGLDLKVGGSGMRAFYDKIVPNVANALLKKLGAGRITEINLAGPGTGEFRDQYKPTEISFQPGFDISPALRESAMRGLPLFSRRRDPGAPILDRDIKVHKNGPGVRSKYKYRATMKGEGVFGFGDTPAEARAKFRELKERFEREMAERRARALQTETPAFKAWFKGSKVVDESGAPLRLVHHGDIPGGVFSDVAEQRRAGIKPRKVLEAGLLGFWFSEEAQPVYGPNRVDAYLSIQKPLYGRLDGKDTQPVTREELHKVVEAMDGYLPPVLSRSAENRGVLVDPDGRLRSKEGVDKLYDAFFRPRQAGEPHRFVHNWGRLITDYTDFETATVIPGNDRRDSQAEGQGLGNIDIRERLTNVVKTLGYDGYVAHDGAWVAFESNQIKSATGNRGTFDPANPDIRYSRATPATATDLPEATKPPGHVTSRPPAGIDAGLSEVKQDSGVTDTELFGDSATAQAIRVQGFDALDRDRQQKVLSNMLTLSKDNPEIFRTVVERVPVDVVDNFIGQKWASKQLRHDPAVLIDALTVVSNLPVSNTTIRFVDAVAVQTDVKALARAKARGAVLPTDRGAASVAPMYSRTSDILVSDILHQQNLPRVQGWFAPRLDALRIKLQDRFLALKRHQQAVEARSGPLPENMDSYLAVTLYHGRADARLKDLKTAHIDPLIEAIHKSGANMDQVEDFLYAMHAPSRNRVLAGRNPRFDPRSEKYGGSPGSGMTDEDSRAILSSAREAGLSDALEAISRAVQALNEATLQGRIADGLMSEEDADGWRKQWENYVPLRGVDGEDSFPRLGHGFTIKGAESKQAFGRASKAGDLLAHVVSAAEEAIVRGEKNKVGQAFLTFAEENASPHWEVKNIQFKPRIDKETGEMTFERDPFYTLADDVFSVKRGGAQFHVKLGDPALARSLKNLGAEDSNVVVRTVGALTRALSFLSTTANPEFLISNFARDIQEAGINLAGEKGTKMAGQVMRDVPKALRGAYQAIRKGDTTSEWAKYYHELERSGGLVGYFDSLTVERQAHRLEGMLKDLDPSKPRQAWIALRAVGKFIQESNQVVESGVRLSAYVNARRAGVSEAQAAALSKNLTVNFNRRGELGPVLNSLYMFFNAGVQGTTRMVQALKHKRTRQIAGGIVGLGVLLEILNQSMSGSGDDEKKYYDKIPEWVKDHNLILMLPDGEHYMMLPLPYGYNVFHAIGRNFGSMFFGHSPLEASQGIVHAGLDAFNPLGGATSIAQFMSPTLTDPIIQQAENLSHFGSPIKPGQSPFGPPRPESSLYWRAVNPAAKEVAAWLNEATGGSQVRPGGVDVSPETIEHWAEFVGGGVGRTLMKTLNTGTRLATGQDLPLKEIPFARRLIGEPDERADAGVYREAVNEVVRARNEIRYFQQAGDAARAAEVRRDYGAELRLYGFAQATDNRISALRRRARLMESRGLKTDAIEEQIDSLKMGFTKRFEAATAPRG